MSSLAESDVEVVMSLSGVDMEVVPSWLGMSGSEVVLVGRSLSGIVIEDEAESVAEDEILMLELPSLPPSSALKWWSAKLRRDCRVGRDEVAM